MQLQFDNKILGGHSTSLPFFTNENRDDLTFFVLQ